MDGKRVRWIDNPCYNTGTALDYLSHSTCGEGWGGVMRGGVGWSRAWMAKG